jgi:deoxyhypusine synthase
LSDLPLEREIVKIRAFVNEHFRHFNAGELQRASASLTDLLNGEGKLFLTLAGAMSTAEIGRSLAQMIRQGHVAAISCTGANMEEDLFKLVAGEHYVHLPNYADLSPDDEALLLERRLNRVTDTCIPEEEAIRHIEDHLMTLWAKASQEYTTAMPHEYLYELLLSDGLDAVNSDDAPHSWLLEAARAKLPLYVPGWEDSTLGNIFAARCSQGVVKPEIIASGTHYMLHLIEFYKNQTRPLAFLQSGGGIAGDFPICVVPLLHQDLENIVPLWSWFAQITDATASYGGYSGAPPNEKITWGKLAVDTPKYNINSDATIVLPLLFGYVLDL